MPQLNEDDISYDYVNEYGYLYGLITLLKKEDVDKSKISRIYEVSEEEYVFSKAPMFLTYTERYDTADFFFTINDKNREIIEKLDDIAIKIRNHIGDKGTDLDYLANLLNESNYLIKKEYLRF
ncbi:hypothetical protein C0585_06505 [Candidatus Woesearchaeota archaeon]|nr:MAG: hypothetical protein C0585_06505 [Candidatus Woesearchaeota archaeon]